MLYYSGAETFLASQTDPQASIGGFVSSSVVQNDTIANLFPSIPTNAKNSLIEYRCVILKNTTGAAITGLSAYTTTPTGAQAAYEIAFTTLSVDSKSQYFAEAIANKYSKPFAATFTSNEGVINELTVGALAIDAYFGIWIKRTIDPAVSAALYDCTVLDTAYTAGTTLATEEALVFTLDWD